MGEADCIFYQSCRVLSCAHSSKPLHLGTLVGRTLKPCRVLPREVFSCLGRQWRSRSQEGQVGPRVTQQEIHPG